MQSVNKLECGGWRSTCQFVAERISKTTCYNQTVERERHATLTTTGFIMESRTVCWGISQQCVLLCKSKYIWSNIWISCHWSSLSSQSTMTRNQVQQSSEYAWLTKLSRWKQYVHKLSIAITTVRYGQLEVKCITLLCSLGVSRTTNRI